VLSDKLQMKVLERVLVQAQLMGPDQQLPAAVRVKHGTGGGGKTIHYYFNFSAGARRIVYPYGAGRELLSNHSIDKGGALMLEPWGVAIVEADAA
jgi:beta-galactosidase